jgi:heat shock protein HslJ
MTTRFSLSAGRFALAVACGVAMTAPSAGLHAAQDGQSQTKPGANRPLESTYWRAVELVGTSTPSQTANREAHLVFQSGRVAGSDGCNRVTGTYTLDGDGVTFGQAAATRMACPDTTAIEQAFHAAMKSASRWRITGERLELLDAAGTRVAVFEARAQTPSGASGRLLGTSWQLVRFQGGDDKTLTPDPKSRYTIEFRDGDQLLARIDCNRGGSTWKAAGSSLELGPLALTRAKCAGGSLHDQIVKQWSFIRSYVIKDKHLFLSLMADGGIYEFEPLVRSRY